MKGNEKVIEMLNTLLADELTAIGQYMVHSEMCHNWGFTKLHDAVEGRAMTEMKHAEKIIARLLFLEAAPTVGLLNKISIGVDIEKQFTNDRAAEDNAVRAYNGSIRIAEECGDYGTAELLQSILKDEEQHLSWLEIQLNLIKQIGLKDYLSTQVN